MSAWLTYVRERFPLPVYALIVGGIALSGQITGARDVVPLPFILSFISVFAFLAMLRLRDEHKDYDKDRVAHPERPSPRGLLAVTKVEKAIRRGSAIMAAWPVLIALSIGIEAATTYWIVVAYLWLMYEEFYIGEWLERRPLQYAISHQVIIFPIAVFSVLAAGTGDGSPAGNLVPGLLLGLLFIGPFFAYEVCRKLDPDADPVLATYLVVYGRGGTFAMIAAAVLVSAFAAAVVVGYYRWLWALHALLLLSATTIWWKPGAHRVPEIIASMVLVAHLWVIPVTFWSSRL